MNSHLFVPKLLQIHLAPRDYTLTATPYAEASGKGTKGIEKKITFKVEPLGNEEPTQNMLVGNNNINGKTKKAVDKDKIRLYPNAPNPFRTATTISFELEKAGRVQLTVLNSQGVLVESLLNKSLPAGKHNLLWQARHISSGVYIVQLSVGNVVKTQRMILMK